MSRDITPEEVRLACQRVISSPGFENSGRLTSFLEYTVGQVLAGKQEEIKEYTIGVEVFGKPQDFDPKTDTIVRVSARRLRQRLDEYYTGEGKADPVRIAMPSPGYVPTFGRTAEPETLSVPEPAPAVAPRRDIRFYAAILGLLLTVTSAVAIAYNRVRMPKISTIAVLPFLDLSQEKNQEYLCDGLTEELTNVLAGIENLSVVARTSSFLFKGKADDIRNIGKQLNADTVIEGSVRRSGDRLRVTVQMIRSSDGYHFWSRNFDVHPTDLFQVQDDVGRAVADHLRNSSGPKPSVVRQPTRDLEAYDYYLLGRHHWIKLTPEDLHKSIELYEKALARDPNFALAYSGISESYAYIAEMGIEPPDKVLQLSQQAAEKALSLDPNLAEAHTSLGISASHRHLWTLAAKELQRGTDLKPSYAYGIHWLGHHYEIMDRRKGLELMLRALALDPLSPMIAWDLSHTYAINGNESEAIRHAFRSKELAPQHPVSQIVPCFALSRSSRLKEALAECATPAGDPVTDAIKKTGLAIAQARSGHFAEATRLREELMANTIAQMTTTQPIWLAAVDAHLGRTQEALALLDKAVAMKSPMVIYPASCDSAFRPLWPDPGFGKFFASLGLPDKHCP